MITFRDQIKVKKQSRRSKILHPVGKWQEKNPKIDFARGPTWHVHPTVDLAWNFHKKYPFVFLFPWIFPRGVITVFLHCAISPYYSSISNFLSQLQTSSQYNCTKGCHWNPCSTWLCTSWASFFLFKTSFIWSYSEHFTQWLAILLK